MRLRRNKNGLVEQAAASNAALRCRNDIGLLG
jgi:hypothetical protein